MQIIQIRDQALEKLFKIPEAQKEKEELESSKELAKINNKEKQVEVKRLNPKQGLIPLRHRRQNGFIQYKD